MPLDDLFEVFEVVPHAVVALGRRLGLAISGVRVGSEDVKVRSAWGRIRHFGLERIDRFEWEPSGEGGHCILLLLDGSTVRVSAVPEHRRGDVTALNNQLEDARR